MNYLTKVEDLQIDMPKLSLYFYTSWMPFHKKMIIMISKIEEKYPDMVFHAIDADQFKTQCKRFSIQSVPTVVVFDKGREIKRINGLILTSAFRHVYLDIYKRNEH